MSTPHLPPREARSRLRAPKTALAACALLAAAAAGAEPVGLVTGVEGQVEIRSGRGTTWAPAALDHQLQLGDWIRTQRAARARILLADDTLLSVDEETELSLDESVLGSATGKPHSVIQQLSGQVLTAVGETFGGETRLEVHTPTAVVGVKGTVFEVRVRKETLTCVYDGKVAVRNANPAVNGEELVPEGFCREVRLGQPPGPVQAPPRDFRSTGPGPEGGAQESALEALLFHRGEQGGGRDDLFDWIADVPPVAAPAEELPELGGGGAGLEAPYEDPVDAALASGQSGISVGGGETPGPSAGGGEAPQE